MRISTRNAELLRAAISWALDDPAYNLTWSPIGGRRQRLFEKAFWRTQSKVRRRIGIRYDTFESVVDEYGTRFTKFVPGTTKADAERIYLDYKLDRMRAQGVVIGD